MAVHDRDGGLLAWWRAGTPEGRRALMAGSLGWMLDSFDVMLYALVLAALMNDLGMAKFTAGLLGSVTLVASAIGGLVFGVVVTWIALFQGHDATPTSEGVSRATTRAVVHSALAVLGLDFRALCAEICRLAWAR